MKGTRVDCYGCRNSITSIIPLPLLLSCSYPCHRFDKYTYTSLQNNSNVTVVAPTATLSPIFDGEHEKRERERERNCCRLCSLHLTYKPYSYLSLEIYLNFSWFHNQFWTKEWNILFIRFVPFPLANMTWFHFPFVLSVQNIRERNHQAKHTKKKQSLAS